MKKISLVVDIQPTEEGGLTTTHRFASSADEEEAKRWPSGGLVQVSHALFVEALRREAYTMSITLLSTGTSLEDLTAKGIEERTRAHLAEMVDQFAPLAAEEALLRIKPKED